jgi:hypothetical protein
MKRYNFILLSFVFTLFCSGSCEDKEGQRFTIQNNSEQEIYVIYSNRRLYPMCYIGNLTKREYENLMYYRAINPHSNKNFTALRDLMLEYPQDTAFIHIFNRVDMDMSCKEFEQKYPLKKEWKVTSTDMEACNWILEYP